MYTYILSKPNEISFNTHILVIAYYVLMYCVTLFFLFSSPCQPWWWPYRKKAETRCLPFDSHILIKFCCVLTYLPYPMWYCLIRYLRVTNTHTNKIQNYGNILVAATACCLQFSTSYMNTLRYVVTTHWIWTCNKRNYANDAIHICVHLRRTQPTVSARQTDISLSDKMVPHERDG